MGNTPRSLVVINTQCEANGGTLSAEMMIFLSISPDVKQGVKLFHMETQSPRDISYYSLQ